MTTNESATIPEVLRNDDGTPRAVVVPVNIFAYLVMTLPPHVAANTDLITDADVARAVERFQELLEDAEDEAWAREYARRAAAGELTEDELATIPWEQVRAELAAAPE